MRHLAFTRTALSLVLLILSGESVPESVLEQIANTACRTDSTIYPMMEKQAKDARAALMQCKGTAEVELKAAQARREELTKQLASAQARIDELDQERASLKQARSQADAATVELRRLLEERTAALEQAKIAIPWAPASTGVSSGTLQQCGNGMQRAFVDFGLTGVKQDGSWVVGQSRGCEASGVCYNMRGADGRRPYMAVVACNASSRLDNDRLFKLVSDYVR
jgi:hypothetical protein